MKKATVHDMELGNLLFGHSWGRYKIDRKPYEGLFAAFLEKHGFDSYGFREGSEDYGFENDTFRIFPYSWDEEDAEEPNFVHKPTGLEIRWYKYPLRDAYTNIDISPEKFAKILDECSRSLES